jgi:hypothetical protein
VSARAAEALDRQVALAIRCSAMPDWDSWRSIGATAWDKAAALGLGSVLGGVIGWFLKRWLGSRDEAAERGRKRVAEVKPYLVPCDGVFTGDHRGHLLLRNDGAGSAFDVTIEFGGSQSLVRIPEIMTGRTYDAPMMRLGDSTFFRDASYGAGEFVVRFTDRFAIKYEITLPVQQEKRPDGRIDPRPEWGRQILKEHAPTKKRLREIGGA